MPLTCNIDARGKRLRLILGILTAVAGIVLLLAWAVPGGSAVAWAVSLAVVAAGGFAVFEARAGWCAIRAMGFRTPV